MAPQHVVLSIVRRAFQRLAKAVVRTKMFVAVDNIHQLRVRYKRALAVLLIGGKVPIFSSRNTIAHVVHPVPKRRLLLVAFFFHAPHHWVVVCCIDGGTPSMSGVVVRTWTITLLQDGVVVVPRFAFWIIGTYLRIL